VPVALGCMFGVNARYPATVQTLPSLVAYVNRGSDRLGHVLAVPSARRYQIYLVRPRDPILNREPRESPEIQLRHLPISVCSASSCSKLWSHRRWNDCDNRQAAVGFPFVSACRRPCAGDCYPPFCTFRHQSIAASLWTSLISQARSWRCQ
jgi:hypothetical protein